MVRRAVDGRTVELAAAIAQAADVSSVTLGLPECVEPSDVTFTFMFDTGAGLCAYNITFTWDGGRRATWSQDISDHEGDLSPGSSAPAHGWCSWRNGTDLLLAYTWFEVEIDGWAHIPGCAPGSEVPEEDRDQALYEPWPWVELAKRITAVLHGSDLPARTGQTYE